MSEGKQKQARVDTPAIQTDMVMDNVEDIEEVR